MKFIYVDQSRGEATPAARMLSAGVNSYNEGGKETQPVEIEFINLNDVSGIYNNYDSNSTVFLVNVPEQLSCRNEDGMIGMCPAISTAKSIVQNDSNAKVYLIPHPTKALVTGIDSIANLLSGISGIVDERGLVMKEVLGKIIEHRFKNQRHRHLLLIGNSSIRINTVKKMIKQWNEDIDAEQKYDYATWRTAMALAQIDRLEPTIGSIQLTSYSTLASALNLVEPLTFFHLNQDDLRRVLKTLARRWLGEEHEPTDRFRLPDYARKHGFPRVPPLISNLNSMKSERKIYKALLSLTIDNQSDLVDMKCCVVRCI